MEGARTRVAASFRWRQLAFGVVCMMLIANLQYGWTLFMEPIQQAQGWTVTEIQWAFGVFIALETWLTPVGGWMVDILGPRRGPKLVMAVGGALVGVSWVTNAYAGALSILTWGRSYRAWARASSTRPAWATR